MGTATFKKPSELSTPKFVVKLWKYAVGAMRASSDK
jgi:hypothetical protein